MKHAEPPVMEVNVQEIPKQVVPMKKEVHANVSFCSECGNKFSETMIRQLTTKGQVFCVHCGAILNTNPIEVVM
jgi:predicted transcriptional regulator